MSGKWKIVNVTVERNCWLYQTGIKTSNKRYSKGHILYVVFILHSFSVRKVSQNHWMNARTCEINQTFETPNQNFKSALIC